MPPTNQTGLFDKLSETWWDDSGLLHALGLLLNPVRLPYAIDVLRAQLGPGTHRVLDLGAGGGLFAEALDDAGYSVVAIDPSLRSLRAGRGHGAISGAAVTYFGGVGEALPFADASFDAVVCMEVLEHVEDAAQVVAEAGRVLRTGGVFIYSGPNRTLINLVGLILIAQDLLGLVPRGTHQWSRLLRPSDARHFMLAAGIDPGETLGVGLRVRNMPRAAWAVFGVLIGRLSYPDAARRIQLASGIGGSIAYQGFGVRRLRTSPRVG